MFGLVSIAGTLGASVARTIPGKYQWMVFAIAAVVLAIWNYIEWCSIAYAITVIGAPAVSVPCGFTASGLPVGLQIAASPLSEGSLLSAAMLFEDTAELSPKIPIDPIDPVDPRPG